MVNKKIDRQLVEGVKKHRCLYDRNSIEFKSKQKRDEAWSDICGELGADEEACKTRWRSIRDRFVKMYSKKLAEGIEDDDNPFDEKQWYLLPHLQFLLEYVQTRPVVQMSPRKMELYAAINDEQLIAEVKKYNLIYARNTLTYNNKQKRAEAWANISSELGTEEGICQRRWRSIRDRYVKINSKRNRADNFFEDTDENWYLLPHLEFLNEYLIKRKPIDFVPTEKEFEVVDVDYSSADPSLFDDCSYSYDVLKSPSNSSCTSPESKRRKTEPAMLEADVAGKDYEQLVFHEPDVHEPDVHEQMCNILDRIKDITDKKFHNDAESLSNKNTSFLKMVDEKLLQIRADKVEDAKMFILNYLHRLTKN